VRQGLHFLWAELPTILAKCTDVLSPRVLRIVEDLCGDWHRLDERIEGVSSEIVTLAEQDAACQHTCQSNGFSLSIDARKLRTSFGGKGLASNRFSGEMFISGVR
jgi:transposase